MTASSTLGSASRRRAWPGVWLAVALLAVAGLSGSASAEDQGNLLAEHINEAQLALPQGLKFARTRGHPVAARFLVDDAGLQLAVTTTIANNPVLLLIDPSDGSLRKTEAVTDPVSLKKVRAAISALAQATITLEQAITTAEQDNQGSRVVGILPALLKGKAVARVTLLHGTDLSTIEQRLQ